MKKKDTEEEIDILPLLKALWNRAWAIFLAMVLCGAAAFVLTKVLITPQYSSKILMYVNNQNNTDGKQSISQGDIAAAQKLVDTYQVILRTQTTLDEVIQRGDLPYTPGELNSMISSDAVNGTEVFYVEVIHPDPEEAARIANLVGEVLPEKIAGVVDGSSVRLVDYAKTAAEPCSPNVKKNMLLSALLGAVICCAIIVVKQLMNDKISGPDYLVQSYQIPVLAVIPDLVASQNETGYYQGEYSSSAKKAQRGSRHE